MTERNDPNQVAPEIANHNIYDEWRWPINRRAIEVAQLH